MEKQILNLLRSGKPGMSLSRLARELHLTPDKRHLLKKKLDALENMGAVVRLKRRYFFRPQTSWIQGRVVTLHKGSAFVRPDRTPQEDIFIPQRYLKAAALGDLVEVFIKKRGKKGKPEGRVLKILGKKRNTVFGLYEEQHGEPFITPMDSWTSEALPKDCMKTPSLKSGMIIEVERGTGLLKEILGYQDDKGVDTRVIIGKYDLSSSFSAKAQVEAEAVPESIGPQDILGRIDYRNWETVTIDGQDARDFDDAVSVKQLSGDRFLLGVHIADVSHYVKPGTALDREAYSRANSVYFPGMTLPMLPEKLSTHICSLKPKEDKLTFSVILEIDRSGRVLKCEHNPSVICSDARLTYESVFKIFEGDHGERRKYGSLVPHLMNMRDLARVLRKNRIRSGSLNFDISEPELVYQEGSLKGVKLFERNEAHQVIEEFMVAANEAVASFCVQEKIPILFRIHPAPSLEALEKLRDRLSHFNLSLPVPGKVSSKDLQSVLNQVKGRPEAKFIGLQVLKCQRLAVYSIENNGHYGLAMENYTHFTSPIRRYPDLMVHRMLKCRNSGQKGRDKGLSTVAQHCSEQERKADEAERDLMEWRILRYLKNKLGEETTGIIADFQKAGMTVELDNYQVDGTVSYSDLSGDYFWKKSEEVLVGRRTGHTFSIGDRVCVVLAAVNPWLRRINLVLSRDNEL